MTDENDLVVLASELRGRPIVAIDCGDDLAEVKDVVFDPVSNRLDGFTLNKRGWFRGSLKSTLPAVAVSAIGPDAVMVANANELVDATDASAPLADEDESIAIMGVRVLSAAGEELGQVTDVIVETAGTPTAVGYQLESAEGPIFVPISAQMALSGENLILPAEASDFIHNDLTGFGAAVMNYRAALERASAATPKADGSEVQS